MIKTFHQILMFAVVAGLLGCDEEPIRVQRVARAPLAAVRTLAVLIPRDDATWFLKISGPAPAVASDEAAFRALAESITFPGGDKPIQWNVPNQWKDIGATPDRFAGFRTDGGIEVTVTQLGLNAKDLLANVNRWRGQIGLPPVDPDELAKLTKPITVAGIAATWVDLLNPGDAVILLKKSAPPAKSQTAAPLPPLKYSTPAGWNVIPASGMRAAAFRIGENDEQVDVTIIPLSGVAGGLTANVNRWRGEVGLPELPPTRIQSEAKEMIVDGQKAVYVDLLGPDGPKRQRTLGVIVVKDGTTWFLKMRGPAEPVARQQAAFESFARSFHIGGGTP